MVEVDDVCAETGVVVVAAERKAPTETNAMPFHQQNLPLRYDDLCWRL